MVNSIVEQLRSWLSSRGPRLVSAGIEIYDRIPGPSSDVPWKAGFGLVKSGIGVLFTVWERTIYQTDLIVMDLTSGKTLVMQEGNPERVEEIDAILDEVVDGLISGKYRRT